MGFKCPVCKKDFGNQKQKWNEHIEKEHCGVGKKAVEYITKMCDATKPIQEDES